MIIASAQTKPERFDTQANLDDHYRLIILAAEHGASLVIFPEMSITGYETEKAAELALTPVDKRLGKLQQLADEKNIVIVAGAPLILHDELFIGSLIFRPKQPVSVYTKQFLHHTETDFFKSSSDFNPVFELNGERFSLAICTDIDHPEHAENASKKQATIYLASIFFTPKGISEAYSLLSGYAAGFRMNVLMSNFAENSWGIEAAGRSAFWNSNGELVAQLQNTDKGLLLVEKTKEGWVAKTIISN